MPVLFIYDYEICGNLTHFAIPYDVVFGMAGATHMQSAPHLPLGRHLLITLMRVLFFCMHWSAGIPAVDCLVLGKRFMLVYF